MAQFQIKNARLRGTIDADVTGSFSGTFSNFEVTMSAGQAFTFYSDTEGVIEAPIIGITALTKVTIGSPYAETNALQALGTSSGLLLKNNAGTTVASFGVGSSSSTNISLSGNVALGSNNLTMTGSIASTGSRVTKVWATDIESTNAPTVGGTAATGTGGLVLATNAALTTPTITSATIGTAAPTTSALANTAALSGDLFPHWFFNQSYATVEWGLNGGNVLAGSGAVTGGTGGKSLQTGTTAGSSAVIYAGDAWDFTATSAGNGQKIDWSKTVIISAVALSSNPLTTNATFRMCFGTTNANPTALDARGVGIVCTYASATTMNVALEVHNGTTLTTSGTLATVNMSSLTNHRYTFVSAAGTVYLFINGSYVGSSTGGPSSVGGSGIYYKAMVLNGTDAANVSFAISTFRIFVKQ